MYDMISRLFIKVFSALLLAITISILPPSPFIAYAAESKTIVSASEVDYPPYSLVDQNNQADGFSVELLRASLKAMGAEVSFEVGPWTEVKQALVDGKVQVLPLVGRTPEREAYFDFTFPYLTMHGTIVTRSDESGIRTLEDLRGKEVALMSGDNAEEFIRRADIGAKIVTKETFTEALNALSKGKHDAVIIQKLLFYQLAKKNNIKNLKTIGKPLNDFKQSFCFAVQEGDRALLDRLNEGLAISIGNGTFDRLYKKWIHPLESYSTQRSRIVIGGDSNYPPYEYLDEEGNPAGFNVELTRAIAKHAGLNIIIQLKPWSQVKEGLLSGQIDMVQGMFYSLERDKEFNFSPPHSTVSHVIVATTDTPLFATSGKLAGKMNHIVDAAGHPLPESLDGLKGKTVVVMKDDIMHDLVASEEAITVVTAESEEAVLEALVERNYNYALASRMPALYWIEKNGWSNLQVVDNTLIASEYCYATKIGDEALLPLFSEGLAAIKASGEYRQIYNRTLNRYEEYDHRYFRLLFITAIVLIVFLIIVVTWNKQLKGKVKEHTEELETEVAIHRRHLQALEEREETINLLLNSTAEGIYGLDREGFCKFFNHAAQKLLDYEEAQVLGSKIHERIAHTSPDGTTVSHDQCRVRKVLKTGIPYHCDNGILWRSDSTPLNVEYWIHPIRREGEVTGVVVTFIDITEKRKLMEHRIRSGQLSSLGELAAGVAHEINNPITGVINYAQILLNKDVERETQKQILNKIMKEGNRIAVIVRSLLNFSHKDRTVMSALDVSEIIHEPLQLLQQQLTRDGVFLDVALDEALPKIYGNAQKLEQVLLNLISNARHALNDKYPETDPDKIMRISAENCRIEENRLVRLIVWDQGVGMSEEHRDKAFNRFFTTRAAGIGTGLGLSIVHEILEEHGAVIEVESEVGYFTKITIDFPVFREEKSS
jgi:two-component system sensor histidine kinase EvgS